MWAFRYIAKEVFASSIIPKDQWLKTDRGYEIWYDPQRGGFYPDWKMAGPFSDINEAHRWYVRVMKSSGVYLYSLEEAV